MKKALNLIIIYFITLISGVLLGSVLYSFYINVLNFVAGTEIKFFTKNDMLYAIFYISFCVLFIVCPLISYYKIRHPGGVPQLITFIILSALTWVIFIPGLFKINDNYIENHYVAAEKEPLSKNYFRQIDDKVYYFTKDFEKNNQGQIQTTAVVIDTDAEYKNLKIKKIIDSPDKDYHVAAEPYREILLKNTLHNDDFPVSVNFKYLITTIKNNIADGLLPFIGYLSLGLVMASIFALTNCFDWKLLNTLLISITSVFILVLNSCPQFFRLDLLADKLAGSGFLRTFEHFGSEPLVVFINFVLSLIFITVGVVMFIVKRHKNRNR